MVIHSLTAAAIRPAVSASRSSASLAGLRTDRIRASSSRILSAMLGKYEENLTGSAERIVRTAEKEQEHRHNWEDSILASTDRDTKRSQWMGLFIFSAIIIASFIFAMYDKVILASILDTLGIIGTFGSTVSLIMGKGNYWVYNSLDFLNQSYVVGME